MIRRVPLKTYSNDFDNPQFTTLVKPKRVKFRKHTLIRKSSSEFSDGVDCVEAPLKILVVDDNPFNVKSIKLMLQHCFNYECDTVSYAIPLILFLGIFSSRSYKSSQA
jgi:hypothetical protein